MGEIKIFESPEFGQIRTMLSASNEPLFCLVDVCRILGLSNPSQVKTRLQQSGVITNEVSTPVVSQGVVTSDTKLMSINFISEPNFYRCVFQSRKPDAERFQNWVCEDVLPSIRKTGGYMIAKDDESDEDLMARAILLAQEKIKERDHRIREIEAKNSQQAERIELQSEELKKQAPKVAYHDEVLTSTSTYNTTNIAKEFGMGAHTLNKILHEKGIQYKMDGQWLLYHKYQDKGYTRTETHSYDNGYGEVHTRQQTVWTERGRQFIHQVMKADLLAKATI